MAGVTHLLGKPAPAFEVTTLDGKPVSLADYKGKALVVNFWATWCGACKLEMPWLAQLREQYAAQGFEVLGIVTDGASDEKVRRVADTFGAKYPILRCNHKAAQAYGGLPYLPESFFIGKDGDVTFAIADANSKEEIEANISKLLGSEPSESANGLAEPSRLHLTGTNPLSAANTSLRLTSHRRPSHEGTSFHVSLGSLGRIRGPWL
jgi:thiol-disulfide isomerase/thioredoxin